MSARNQFGPLKVTSPIPVNDKKHLDALINAIAAYAGMEPGEFIQKQRLGEWSLEYVVPYVERIIRLLRLLYEAPPEELPSSNRNQIRAAVDSVNNTLTSLKQFKPGQTRDQTLSSIRESWEQLYLKVVPELIYVNMLSDREVSQAADKLSSLEAVASEAGIALVKSQKFAEEANTVLAGIRNAAAEVGVTNEALRFGEAASKYRNASYGWLVAVIALSAVTLLYAFTILPEQIAALPSEITGAKLWHLLVGKVLVASLLFFVLAWAARNYSASRHNFVANYHRQTALSTYRALVEGVKDDPQARNAILIAASSAIFSPGASGYVKGETDQPQPWMIEVVRAATKVSTPNT